VTYLQKRKERKKGEREKEKQSLVKWNIAFKSIYCSERDWDTQENLILNSLIKVETLTS